MASVGRSLLSASVRGKSVLRGGCCVCKRATLHPSPATILMYRWPKFTYSVSRQCVQNFTSTNAGLSKHSPVSPHVTEDQANTDGAEFFGISEEQMSSLVEEILTKAGQEDIMVQALNRRAVKELFGDLFIKGWSHTLIRDVFVSTPVYLTRSKSQVSKLIDTFVSFGFTNEQVAVLMQSGAVTNFRSGRLSETLDALRKIGMRDKKLPQILTNFPELLLQDPSAVLSRAAALKGLFKTDDIVPLVLGAPNIVFDDWSKIHEIFHYVFSEMGIKQRQMVNSKLFSYPLNFVKTRHIFVLRAGFYVRPHRDDDPVRKTNPRLTDILDTSDERFAKTFGNMSLKDYKAFSAMMKREFATAAQEKDDTESDDDYDD